MTRLEIVECKKLAEEAIQNANNSKKEFEEAARCYDTTERHILETKAWNHRGYAEGIIQALNVIGFKHEQMAELWKLIS